MATQTRVVVCAPHKPDDAPSLSGFCQKLEVFLKHSGIPYEKRSVYPAQGPKKKVPFVEITQGDQQVTIPDTHFIIRYMVEHGIVKDPDDLAGITPEQKAESRAFEAYVEVLYSTITYERWLVKENYPVTSREVFGDFSFPLRNVMSWMCYRKVNGLLWAAGMGRHSWEEVRSLQREAFEVLEVMLRRHKFFHGDEKPSQIDLTVYGFLASAFATGGNPDFLGMVLGSPVMTSFVKEMTVSLFPEYKDLLKKIEESRVEAAPQ